MPIWLREKLWIGQRIEAELADLGYDRPGDLWFAEHHESHAASAFFPSPFESAAVLTFDGVGEWATTSIGVGRGHELDDGAPAQLPATRSACSTPRSPTTAASGSTPASTS